jgi:hypothetical protein
MSLKGDMFRYHGGHQIEFDGRTPEDYKKKKPSAGASNNGRTDGTSVCACTQGTYFEDD